jgi:hypothetical protein
MLTPLLQKGNGVKSLVATALARASARARLNPLELETAETSTREMSCFSSSGSRE